MKRTIILLKSLLGICNRKEKRAIYLLLVMMIIGACMEVIGVGIIVPFIGLLANPDFITQNDLLLALYVYMDMKSVNDFVILVGLCLIVIYLLKNLYLAFTVYAQSNFLFNKQAKMARDLLQIYMGKPYAFHLQRDTSELLQNITTEAINVANGVMLPMLQLLTEGIVLLFIVLFLFYMEPLVAFLVIIIMLVLSIVIIKILGKTLKHHGVERKQYVSEMIKWVNQGLFGVKESKIMGKENYFVDSFFEKSLGYVRSAKIYAVLSVVPRYILETVAVVIMMLVVLLSVAQGKDTQESVSILVLFAVAMIRIMPSVNRMTTSVNAMVFYHPALKTYQREYELVEKRIESITPETKKFKFVKQIEFENVDYYYEGSPNKVFNNISLCIPKNSSVAFSGPSGAGKSTLVDLVIGLHSVSSGRVNVDNVNIEDVRDSWQKRIGYVPQNIYMLDGSIRENVAFGLPNDEIDDNKVSEALRKAQLSKMIESLEEGLDTKVGENGLRISGGEKQRIGIARALYNNPDVIIFDEATSALDQETENAVSDTIRTLFGKKTVIIIAHRLSTIKYCDNIYLLKNGEIEDSGSYEYLKSNNDGFRQMVNDQKL